MSQLRLDPLTGRWVAISAERALRPHAFASRTLSVEDDPDRECPFCPGHEHLTPPTLLELGEGPATDAGGAGRWRVRVVPNKFPAFDGDEPMVVTHLGPVFTQAPAGGRHEVVVFTPEHGDSLADLTAEQVGLVMLALRARLTVHADTPGLRTSQAIVNFGREAGASIEHPHGQLLAIPFVPRSLADEIAGFGRFHGGCLLCTTWEAELASGERVIHDDDEVVAVCPFWSGSPFEMLIIPKEHRPQLNATTEVSATAVGQALQSCLGRLRATVGDVAYNLVFHSAPFRAEGPYHWHVHVIPKLTTRAGFELGTGVLLNIMPPEQAAEALLAAP